MDQDFCLPFGAFVDEDFFGYAAIDRVAAEGALTARHGCFVFVCDAWSLMFVVFAGIRDLPSVLHALPLCGAAPTFLCRGKEK
ncbi:MAG TPA: hypothetical protein VN289_15795 [Paraburkholderia sp.]|nr:hypothetical protein [Paraburkholderia sp.]